MDALISVLLDIKMELEKMNDKLDAITCYGTRTFDDVCDKIEETNNKLEDLRGTGLYNSVSDICDKLDTIDTSLTCIDLKIC